MKHFGYCFLSCMVYFTIKDESVRFFLCKSADWWVFLCPAKPTFDWISFWYYRHVLISLTTWKSIKCHTFLVSFITHLSWPEGFACCFVTLWKIFSKIAHQTALREMRSNKAPFSYKLGLRKFALASELFVLRPYFIRHFEF